MKPDYYEKLNLGELYEILEKIDRVKYPDRFAKLNETIKKKENDLNVESFEINFNDSKAEFPAKKPVDNRANTTHAFENIILVLISSSLIVYGAFGIYKNDIFVPIKRAKDVHYSGAAAWFLFAAMLSLSMVLLSIVAKNFDKRDNEHIYSAFREMVTYIGIVFIVIAAIIHVSSGS